MDKSHVGSMSKFPYFNLLLRKAFFAILFTRQEFHESFDYITYQITALPWEHNWSDYTVFIANSQIYA